MGIPERNNASMKVLFYKFIDGFFRNGRIRAIDRNEARLIMLLAIGSIGKSLRIRGSGLECLAEKNNIVKG